MQEHERNSIELLVYRIHRLEESIERRRRDDLSVERAIQAELHELRHEQPEALLRTLRADYYTKDAARNVFMTREELQAQRKERREWPIILAGVTVALVSLANLIITLRGGR